MRRAFVVVAAILCVSVRPAHAQHLTAADSGVVRMLAPDSAEQARAVAAGAAVLYWAANTGSREQSIYVRNTSEHAVRVADFEVTECYNLSRRLCGRHAPGPVIRPGATVVLVRITPREPTEAWSYRYQVHAEFVPDEPQIPVEHIAPR